MIFLLFFARIRDFWKVEPLYKSSIRSNPCVGAVGQTAPANGLSSSVGERELLFSIPSLPN
jgi:hypothetical protein